MEKIPLEILANILETFPLVYAASASDISSTVYRRQLAQYTAVSRAWKALIERYTFKSLTITTNELDAFAALFSGENISRRAALTTLNVIFVLPKPQNALGCCPVVRTLDRQADSFEFSASVAKLFTILADLEARATEKPLLLLSFLGAYRLSEEQEPKGTERVPCMPPYGKGRQHSRREVMEANALSGQFELVREEAVPTLQGITSFEFRGLWALSDLKPTWIPEIFRRLSGVQSLLLTTKDKYEDGRNSRHAQRECFLASACSLAGDHLREIRIHVPRNAMRNERLPVHKFIENNRWKEESWSRMFNHFASLPNLAALHLLGGLVICPEFFRGISDHSGTPYPSLREFELQFSAETADGRWFYEGDNDAVKKSRSDPEWKEYWEQVEEEEDENEDDTGSLDSNLYVRAFEDEPFRTDVVDDDRFRSRPDAATFLPFLMDAAKAVSRLDNLQKLILKLGNRFSRPQDVRDFPIVSRVFELWYLKAGTLRSPKGAYPSLPGDAAYLDRNRIYWRVDRWQPWDEMQTEWSAIAGQDAKVVFLAEDRWTYFSDDSIWTYEGEF
ncbi:hypothetical protein BDW02DRAFT_633609 [Decorospora gaudefroyi]|uniref:F-box domain-containing protein n=1 Tax=Decorospora gaudefroyi TaxID=184978 RepID=A0A6A5K7C3_9PLEO|nr:hypothetical protein BDW02DRAFT_633609 [Decorospora gaudefroyi]